MTARYSRPEPIRPEHGVVDFRNQHPELAEWLRRRALRNESARASRTHVVCEDGVVVGFHALAAGSIETQSVPGGIRRNMPSPIPAIVLGRLAVDIRHQGAGLGAALLRDAVARSLRAAEAIGARVLLCHAVDDRASDFYLRHGFLASTNGKLTLMLDLRRSADWLLPP